MCVCKGYRIHFAELEIEEKNPQKLNKKTVPFDVESIPFSVDKIQVRKEKGKMNSTPLPTQDQGLKEIQEQQKH